MDLLFTRNKIEDVDHDTFLEARPFTLPTEIMNDNWAGCVDDEIMDSIFPLDHDFFKNFDETQGFDSLDELSTSIKMETDDYEAMPLLHSDYNSEYLTGSTQENTSSRSSDSGLSSDHLDTDLHAYDMISTDVKFSLSPPPDNNNKMMTYTSNYKLAAASKGITNNNVISAIPSSTTTIKSPTTDQKPKVVVQKVPQMLSLSNDKDAAGNATTPPTTTTASGKQQTDCHHLTNGKEIKIVKLSPKLFTTPNNKTVTIQVKNSNSGAKIQANPGTLFINKTKFTEVKKLVRVQNNSNPRSVLIPVSIQNMKDFKTIKLGNNATSKSTTKKMSKAKAAAAAAAAAAASNPSTGKKAKANSDADGNYSDNSSDSESVSNEDDDCSNNYKNNNHNFDHDKHGKNYPKLMLTSEERRLLSKEGITLPSHYPLTKNEERELKRIRRKIRNKISAQDSRKRKKEYVDGLEERVKQCTADNQTLMKKIKLLQSQNHNLASQMKKLQMLITKGTNKTAQPTTCLMVLLLSLALVAAPNLRLNQNSMQDNELVDEIDETITIQNRRSLLYDTTKEQPQNHHDLMLDDINMMNDVFGINDLGFLGQSSASATTQQQSCNNCLKTADSNKCNKNNDCTCEEAFKQSQPPPSSKSEFTDFDVDDENWYKSKRSAAAVVDQHKMLTIDNSFMQEKILNIQDNKNIDEYIKNIDLEHQNIMNKYSTNMKIPSLHNDVLMMNAVDKNDLFDEEMLEMISLKRNGLYELNLDKMQGFDSSSSASSTSSGGVYLLGGNTVSENDNNEKRRNFSETQIF